MPSTRPRRRAGGPPARPAPTPAGEAAATPGRTGCPHHGSPRRPGRSPAAPRRPGRSARWAPPHGRVGDSGPAHVRGGAHDHFEAAGSCPHVAHDIEHLLDLQRGFERLDGSREAHVGLRSAVVQREPSTVDAFDAAADPDQPASKVGAAHRGSCRARPRCLNRWGRRGQPGRPPGHRCRASESSPGGALPSSRSRVDLGAMANR